MMMMMLMLLLLLLPLLLLFFPLVVVVAVNFWMNVSGLNVKCLWLCSGIALVVAIVVVVVVVLVVVLVVVVTVVGSIGTCFHAVGKFIYVLFILHYVFLKNCYWLMFSLYDYFFPSDMRPAVELALISLWGKVFPLFSIFSHRKKSMQLLSSVVPVDHISRRKGF